MLNPDAVIAFFRWLLGEPQQPLIPIPVEEENRAPARRVPR
ncbi:hypothetical protein P886_2052 [Alteromonadaceae bacterium 2753L.S.0a.02]|nr:hypothetical protein P886_2052 [Alteromonadaceae bacterium 2753L.S.0a.02]